MMCPHNAICLLILLYVSSYCYVSSYSYMCPHTTIRVPSVLILLYFPLILRVLILLCVLILLYLPSYYYMYLSRLRSPCRLLPPAASSYCHIRVPILLYVSSHCYMYLSRLRGPCRCRPQHPLPRRCRSSRGPTGKHRSRSSVLLLLYVLLHVSSPLTHDTYMHTYVHVYLHTYIHGTQ